jgi:hypothetical protein
MDVLLFLSLVFSKAVILAILLCRYKANRGFRPSVWLAFVAVFVSLFTFSIGFFLLSKATSNFFEWDVKSGYWIPAIIIGFSIMITLPAAAMIVAKYQKKVANGV